MLNCRVEKHVVEIPVLTVLTLCPIRNVLSRAIYINNSRNETWQFSLFHRLHHTFLFWNGLKNEYHQDDHDWLLQPNDQLAKPYFPEVNQTCFRIQNGRIPADLVERWWTELQFPVSMQSLKSSSSSWNALMLCSPKNVAWQCPIYPKKPLSKGGVGGIKR